MSKYMERAKELRGITTPHYNCAQSVLLPFAEDLGLTEEMAFNLGFNFGGGMKIASTCGAFTGGLMVLGLYGVNDPKIIAAYARRIRDNHQGYLDCADLLRINKEQGGEKKAHCDQMVYENIAIVEELLRAHGKIQ